MDTNSILLVLLGLAILGLSITLVAPDLFKFLVDNPAEQKELHWAWSSLLVFAIVALTLVQVAEKNRQAEFSRLQEVKQRVLAAKASGAGSSSHQNSSVNSKDQEAPITTIASVTQVIDGDTFKAKIKDEIRTVRLLGIDTPELAYSSQPAQCGAQAATNRLQKLLENQTVYLVPDLHKGEDCDTQNRLLRYVFLPDDTLINHLLIKEGLAREFTYNTPYQYQRDFRSAQAAAQNHQRGIWNPQMCP